MRRIADFYILRPILTDIIICILIWVVGTNLSLIEFKLTNKEIQISILSSIIGTDVSLAGFILAALTIIVTFKSNIKTKGMEEATDALELIFSSSHYRAIKRVFKLAIIEFVLGFIVLYAIWILSENLTIQSLNLTNICGLFVTSIISCRTLAVLFNVMDLDENKV
jgi:glycerol uptake facilitator-like aquaporin